jgi:hypothetical protein
MKHLLCLWLMLTPAVLASPLMTEEYPLWVQDAVRSLRQQGLVSAGCLPDQALTRSDLAPLLDKIFQLQEKQEAQLAPKTDLQEIRSLMESLLEQTARMNAKLEAEQGKVNKQAEATGDPLPNP